jgi:malate dehydrogenase (oxaloacetate-decarboxylating)
VLKYGKKKITDEMKIRAAEALASVVTNPNDENILPNALDKSVASVVAEAMRD